MRHAEYLRSIGSDLLVAWPNRQQYGHLGLEIAMSLARARQERRPLFLLRPRRTVNDALFELESDEVVLVPRSLGRQGWLLASWLAEDALPTFRSACMEALDNLRHLVEGELFRAANDARFPENMRQRLRSVKQALGRLPRRPPLRPVDQRAYFQRSLLREAVRVRLRPPALRRAEDAARRVGIPLEGPLVTIHAREPGYKRRREIQEKLQRSAGSRDDSTRNASVETYFAAVDELVRRGFTIVRLGDPTMKPVVRHGVVDLATSPHRTPELEVWALLRSKLLICGESGPHSVAYLTNTPTLTVNATDPIDAFPLRGDSSILLKHVVDRAGGRELTLSEMLSENYFAHLRDPAVFEYRDNTADEILDATREIVDVLEGCGGDTAWQRDFRRRGEVAGRELAARMPFVQKWGPDDGFLGLGRYARAHESRL